MPARYYAGYEPLVPGGEVELSPEESRHLVKTMRARPGDALEVFGSAGLFKGTFLRTEDIVAIVEVGEALPSPDLPSVHLTFIIPWIKGGKTDFLIQKLTELGASRIIVFHARREVARGDETKFGRMNRIAQEACKQCERIDVPEIVLATTLDVALGVLTDVPVEHRFLLHERDGARLLGETYASLSPKPTHMAIASGPEGGWHPAEIPDADQITYVSLGKRIVRAETAPLAAAAAILALSGDL